jgi:hypothetical protein
MRRCVRAVIFPIAHQPLPEAGQTLSNTFKLAISAQEAPRVLQPLNTRGLPIVLHHNSCPVHDMSSSSYLGCPRNDNEVACALFAVDCALNEIMCWGFPRHTPQKFAAHVMLYHVTGHFT